MAVEITLNSTFTQTRVNVSSTVIHQTYDESREANDIAFLVLPTSNEALFPICVSPKGLKSTDYGQLNVTGVVRRKGTGLLVDNREKAMTKIDEDSCQKRNTLNKIDVNSNLCAVGPGDRDDFQQVDLGAPVVVNTAGSYMVAGLLNRIGRDNRPWTFTKAATYID